MFFNNSIKKQSIKNHINERNVCFLLILGFFKNKQRSKFAGYAYFLTIIFIFIFFIQMFSFPTAIHGDEWLKVESPGQEKIWVDTSHWESKEVYINDGYYREIEKKRWVDTSYIVNDGYWKTGNYRVWVKSSKTVPYTEYRYVDTSCWEATVSYVEVQKPVYFSKIYGTDSYGWSVYSFASKYKGMKQITYNGEKYLVHVYTIDYRPARGGQVYAVKYVFVFKFVKEKRTSTNWVSSGYWKPYTDYRVIDTSHWEERTGVYWVDTSYKVESGHWENYIEKQWVDTSHYEYKNTLVSSGYYAEPFHGKITVQKSPEYIFTRWHKNGQGSDCGMELAIMWEIDNSERQKDEELKKIGRLYIYQETIRYKDKGIIKTVIFDKAVSPSEKGSIETFTRFDYAGNEKSTLHIYLYAQSGEVVHAYFSNPVNGYRSINIGYNGTSNKAESFSGGHNFGEVIF
ncbi:MAG: hypothetical protein JW997_04525 [Actinobacteria bacterium]|nr:hypothetical protein [Actinomycetota bacterium]